MNFVIIVFCYVLRLEMFSRVSAALRIFIFVARSVVCVSVCLSVRHSSEPCKAAEPLEMPFGGRLARAQRTTTWGGAYWRHLANTMWRRRCGLSLPLLQQLVLNPVKLLLNVGAATGLVTCPSTSYHTCGTARLQYSSPPSLVYWSAFSQVSARYQLPR